MDAKAAKAWRALVNFGAQQGWTNAMLCMELSVFDLQDLMPVSFDPEEPLSADLESLWNNGSIVNLAELSTTITSRYKRSPISYSPRYPLQTLHISSSNALPKAAITKKTAKAKKTDIIQTTIVAKVRKRSIVNDEKSVPVAKKHKSSEKVNTCGLPLVWSNRRQELCETVPYYNSYESSWYHPKGDARAMLLAEDQSQRSYADIDVIITRATGGMAEDPKRKGSMIQSSSHTETQQTVIAVKNAKDSKQAIILIGSEKCGLPVILPYNYQVLEHYWVTDTWWEKINGFKVFRYRFERCNLFTQAWYMPSNREFHKPDFSIVCHVQECKKCGKECPQVYQVWLCLNHSCKAFWRSENGVDAEKMTLELNQAFVNKRSHFTGQKRFEIKPELFQPTDNQELQFAYSRGGWTGFWCDQCGKCSSREDWAGWECSCGNKYKISTPVLRADETDVAFNDDNQLVCVSLRKMTPSSIKSTSRPIAKYIVDSYEILPKHWIYHFRSTEELNAQPNGPDQLFKEMQEAKNMKLLRRINGKLATDSASAKLTRHFAENYGLHYRYIVAQGSTPFSSAPAPVCHALQRLIWAGKVTKMDVSKPFNEMLVVGYMSEGRMGYHDDGEDSLGPTISTLSLGCKASMKFRYKAKYYDPPLDFKSGNFKPESVVLPGVPLEAERKAHLKWSEKHLDKSLDEQSKHFKSLAKVKAQMVTGRRFQHKDSLQLLLNHGDMVIMHGADIQRYMEHQVEARGCLRFALTSRHVLPDKVDPSTWHMGDVDLSEFPEYEG